MANIVIAMKLIKARFILQIIMAMDNYIQKGSPTDKIFNNESVSLGGYQSWISQMRARVILKISSGTALRDATKRPGAPPLDSIFLTVIQYGV